MIYLWQCGLMATVYCCLIQMQFTSTRHLISHSVTLSWQWASQLLSPIPVRLSIRYSRNNYFCDSAKWCFESRKVTLESVAERRCLSVHPGQDTHALTAGDADQNLNFTWDGTLLEWVVDSVLLIIQKQLQTIYQFGATWFRQVSMKTSQFQTECFKITITIHFKFTLRK